MPYKCHLLESRTHVILKRHDHRATAERTSTLRRGQSTATVVGPGHTILHKHYSSPILTLGSSVHLKSRHKITLVDVRQHITSQLSPRTMSWTGYVKAAQNNSHNSEVVFTPYKGTQTSTQSCHSISPDPTPQVNALLIIQPALKQSHHLWTANICIKHHRVEVTTVLTFRKTTKTDVTQQRTMRIHRTNYKTKSRNTTKNYMQHTRRVTPEQKTRQTMTRNERSKNHSISLALKKRTAICPAKKWRKCSIGSRWLEANNTLTIKAKTRRFLTRRNPTASLSRRCPSLFRWMDPWPLQKKKKHAVTKTKVTTSTPTPRSGAKF